MKQDPLQNLGSGSEFFLQKYHKGSILKVKGEMPCGFFWTFENHYTS